MGASAKDFELLLAGLAATGLAPGLLAMAAMRFGAEARWAAGPPRPRHDAVNFKVWLTSLGGHLLLAPSLGGVTTLLVNRAGGGWIVLPSHGWALALGAVAYLVAMDFAEYAFHRAQHAFPWLWAMHALHHSDTHFDTTTTVRHFWLDPVLKSVSVWLAVGLLFKAAAPIVLVYALAGFYNYAIHSNTRLDFGRWSWVLNSPGYHRIHHSASAEHFDVNFAALLPVFDVVFGGYRPARPGERPATGLDTGEDARTWTDVAAWPVRGLLRRRSAQLTAA